MNTVIMINLAIILIDFYFIIKIGRQLVLYNKGSFWNSLLIIAIQVMVAITMLHYSPKILGIRFDFRIILYTLLMKHLGRKITLPTIAIMGVYRYFSPGLMTSEMNVIFTIFLLVTLPSLYEFVTKYFSGLMQVLMINYIYLLVIMPTYIYRLESMSLVLQTVAVVWVTMTGSIIFISYIIRDIIRQYDLVTFDSLSQLYNNRHLQENLLGLSKNSRGYALAIIDIDDFKHYNDQYGHLAGDEVIRQIGGLLKSLSNPHATAYRYGGEEFVLIVKDTDGKTTYKIAQQIMRDLRHLKIYYQEEVLEITASLGIAYQQENEPLTSTFRRADQALYTAKLNGKDQIVIG